MKRLWIGIGLLVAILIGGLWTAGRMAHIHTDISDALTQSAKAAQDGQWDRALALGQGAKKNWREKWKFSAAMADHTMLDEIDQLFAQAEVYGRNREGVAYAATCAQLAAAIDALQEGHKLSWWNLL